MSDDPFSRKYKNYQVIWCDLCDCFSIKCADCLNISCNGATCAKCHEDSVDFSKNGPEISDYLTEEENKAYLKARRLKDLIFDALERDELKLDFNKLKEEGNLSQNDIKMFGLEKDPADVYYD